MGWVEANNGLFVPGGDQSSFGLPPGQRPLSVVKNGWTWDDPRRYPLNRYGSEMRYSSWEEMALDGWQRSGLTDADFKFFGDAVEVTFPAQGNRLFRLAPAGDFDVIAHMEGPFDSVPTSAMIGLGIVDVNGTGVGGSMYDSGTYAWRITTWNYASTIAGGSMGSVAIYLNGAHYWSSLRKIGTDTTWRFSPDQSTWTSRTWTPTAFVPAYFGVVRFFSTGGTTPKVIIHRVLVVPGVWVP